MDDLPEEFGTATAAKHSGLSQRFINQEIARKNLKAEDFEGRARIRRDDFLRWLNKPNRGIGAARQPKRGRE